MRSFEAHNPAVIFAYFMLTSGIAMFCLNPVITGISFTGAVVYYLIRNKTAGAGFHFFSFFLLILLAILNPLMYHNGRTVLFILNDNPVTLEALIYGINSSAMIIGIMYWFRSFSQIMTSDKLLYIFGRISPKFALIFSMTLRYIPLFGRQIKKTNAAQKALGLYRDDNAVDAIRGGSRVFSVMVTWALENGIITADSMSARGYGTGKRSFYEQYRFSKSDALLLASIVTGFVLFVILSSGNYLSCEFYPSFLLRSLDVRSAAAYIAYLFVCLLPSVIEIGERIAWHYLKSGI